LRRQKHRLETHQRQQNKALHPTAYSPLVPRSLPAAGELDRCVARVCSLKFWFGWLEDSGALFLSPLLVFSAKPEYSGRGFGNLQLAHSRVLLTGAR
jgi:hypothetical protein